MARSATPIRNARFAFQFILSIAFIFVASASWAADDDSTLVSGTSEGIGAAVAVIDAASFQRLPVRTLEDWLALQPGVAVPYPGSREIHIRGGREYHNAFMLNGVRSGNPFTGRLSSTFSPYALGQLRLNSGGGGAPYGGFSGGLLRVDSPMGGEKISGSAATVSDNVGTGFDQNWYNLTLSGPLGQTENLRFFAAAERRYLGDHRPSSRAAEVLPGGEKGLPGNGQQGWSYHGKIDWRASDRTSVSAWGDYSLDDIQTYRHEFYYFPEHSPRTEDKTLSFGTSINAQLSPKTSLRGAVYYYQAETVHGDGVLFDDYLAYQRGVLNPVYDQFNLFRDSSSLGVTPYYDYFLKNKVQYLGIDGSVTIEAGNTSTVTAGFDARRYTVRLFENLSPSFGFAETRVNRYGYDTVGVESDDDSGFDGPKHPLMGGVYVQDRLNFKSTTVTAGVRVDYFDLKGSVLSDPLRPLGPDESTLDVEDLTKSQSYLRFSPQVAFSTLLGRQTIVFGVVGTTNEMPPFWFTYSGWEFFEARMATGMYTVYGMATLEPERTNRAEIGIKNHSSKKLSGMVKGFIVERRKSVGSTGRSAVPYGFNYYGSLINGRSAGVEVSLNIEPAPTVHIDLSYAVASTKSHDVSQSNIAWKVGNATTEKWPVAYDQTHKFVGVFDFHTGPGEGPLLGGTPLLQDLSLSVVAYAASGFRYTKGELADEVSGVGVAQNPAGEPNQERSPAVIQIDLKIQRTIRFGQFNLVPFLWIENLLDRENILHVYSGTGEPDNTGYLGTPEGESRADDPTTGAEFVRRYELRQDDPNNFGTPRQVYFGLRAEF